MAVSIGRYWLSRASVATGYSPTAYHSFTVGKRQFYRHSFKCNRSGLSHITDDGGVSMVNISSKPISDRSATSLGEVVLCRKAFELVKANGLVKGDVLTISKLAGIMAAKNTWSLIPLCHHVLLSDVQLDLTVGDGSAENTTIYVSCTVHSKGQTGVEMEAITGTLVSMATVYDMCKSVSHDILLTNVRLVRKSGGQSDEYTSKK